MADIGKATPPHPAGEQPTEADVLRIADQHGHRWRSADEEGISFEKSAFFDFAAALLRSIADHPATEAVLLTEDEALAIIGKTDSWPLSLTYDSGAYEVTCLKRSAERLFDEIQRAVLAKNGIKVAAIAAGKAE